MSMGWVGVGWGDQYQFRMVEPFGVRDDGPGLIEGARLNL